MGEAGARRPRPSPPASTAGDAAAGRPLQTVDATTASEATRFLLSPKVLALRWDYYVRQAVAARPWLAGDAIAPAR